MVNNYIEDVNIWENQEYTTRGNRYTKINEIIAAIRGGNWQGSVKDKDLTGPPGGEATGDRYIPAATATGAWAGKEDNIAIWDGLVWQFVVPLEGMMAWVEDDNVFYYYTGSAWTLLIIPLLDEDDFVSNSDTEGVTQQSAKVYIDAHMDDGIHWMSGLVFVGSGVATTVYSDGFGSLIIDSTGTMSFRGTIDLQSSIRIGGSLKYLTITAVEVSWFQANSIQLTSFLIYRQLHTNPNTRDTVKSDPTSYGSNGYNSHIYNGFSNNVLTSTKLEFHIQINCGNRTLASDFRLRGCKITYNYA